MESGTKMMNFGYNGLWALLVLAGDIWAIINILQSSASDEKSSFASAQTGCPASAIIGR